jgi:exodeoxyribonuclease VII small subunit
MAREARAGKQQEHSFEQLYAQLEEKVGKLEQGGLPLDEAIALYEEGMALARECQERLEAAEQRITKLRESFAPVGRTNGAMLAETPHDYEYVNDDDALLDDGDEGQDSYP